MVLGLDFLIFICSCVVLATSASLLIRSLTKLTSFLRISEFVAAFILMAFATSVPELFVGISSALANNGALVLGTVIGANIADLTLVAGITIMLVKGIKVESVGIKRDVKYMFLIMVLPMVLMFIGEGLSRLDGLILIFIFIFYVLKLFRERKSFRKTLTNHVPKGEVLFYSFLFIFMIVVLFVSSRYIVEYANYLAIGLNVPLILIGLFLVALGTTLPELIFGSSAVLSGHAEMNLGNLMGSVVVNSTLVLGVSALISPITANFLLFLVSGIFMILVGFLFLTFIQSGDGFDWREGVSLVLLYVFLVMVEFFLKGIIVG